MPISALVPVSPIRTVTSLTPLALRAFLASSTSTPTPLRLTSLVSHWPALKWTALDGFDQLRNAVDEHTAVDIEIGKRGRGYLDPEWQRVTMGFGLFLDAFILNRIPSSIPSSLLPVGYLAQYDLATSSSKLLDSVPELEHYTHGQRGDMFRRTLWVGPSGSFTPFHRDPYVGLYTQVVGSKTFFLCPPEAGELLDLSEQPLHKNTSRIPVPVSHIFTSSDSNHNVLPSAHEADIPPRILKNCKTALTTAFSMPGACTVSLGPGETVLVPEGWWHSAEGEGGPGVGVGAWFR